MSELVAFLAVAALPVHHADEVTRLDKRAKALEERGPEANANP